MEEFKIGDKVEILDEYKYFTDYKDIPKELIIHGIATPGKESNATIVNKHNQYYIVNFINDIGKTMQLGYESESLKLVERKEVEVINNFILW